MKRFILITLISCLLGNALYADTPNQRKALELGKKHYNNNKDAIDKRANQILIAFNKKQRLLNPASCYSVDPSICLGLAAIEPFLYEAVKGSKELQKFIDSVDCKMEYSLCGQNAFTYEQYKIFVAFEFLKKNQEAYAEEYALSMKLMNEDIPLLVIKKYSNE